MFISFFGAEFPACDWIPVVGMLLKPISASDALYTGAVEQLFLHDPNGMAQLLAIDSCGTFEGKLRPRSDAGGAREDWAKQCATDLDDIMRDAAEAQTLLVETFSSWSGFEPSTPSGRRSIPFAKPIEELHVIQKMLPEDAVGHNAIVDSVEEPHCIF